MYRKTLVWRGFKTQGDMLSSVIEISTCCIAWFTLICLILFYCWLSFLYSVWYMNHAHSCSYTLVRDQIFITDDVHTICSDYIPPSWFKFASRSLIKYLHLFHTVFIFLPCSASDTYPEQPRMPCQPYTGWPWMCSASCTRDRTSFSVSVRSPKNFKQWWS